MDIYTALNALPFVAYFLGIFIRHQVIPGKNSPPLRHQLLLGIPMSLILVSPMLAGIDWAKPAAFLTVIGYIILHGMSLQEAANRKLRELFGRDPAAPLASG